MQCRLGIPYFSQALFRPVSMCIPDLALICEIMLMAEGFQQSKVCIRRYFQQDRCGILFTSEFSCRPVHMWMRIQPACNPTTSSG